MKRMLSRVEARPPDTSPHPATFSRSEAAVSGTSTLCPVTEQHQAAGSHSPGSVESTATGSPDEEGVVVVGGGAGGRRLQLLQLLDHKLRLNNQISHFMVVISRILMIFLY